MPKPPAPRCPVILNFPSDNSVPIGNANSANAGSCLAACAFTAGTTFALFKQVFAFFFHAAM